jgi:hypothetical protein
MTLWSSSLFAAPPTIGPNNENPGWLFKTYFENLADNECVGSDVLTGVDNTLWATYFTSKCNNVWRILWNLFSTAPAHQPYEAVVGFNATTWAPIFDTVSGTGWWLYGNGWTTAGSNFIGTTDNVDLVVKTNGSERMRVKNDTWTIGMTISRSIYSSGWLVSQRNMPWFYLLDMNTRWAILNTDDSNYFNLYATDPGSFTVSSTPLSINLTNGNVGIGTGAPWAKLDVNGSVNANRLILSGNNPWTRWDDTDLVVWNANVNRHDSSISIISLASAWKLKASWNTLSLTNWNNTDNWTFKTANGLFSGNVGIGVVTAWTKLDVAGWSIRTTNQFISSVLGSAPLVVSSSGKVVNLNADMLDGYTAWNDYWNIPVSNGIVNLNLNADYLDGRNSTYFAPITSPSFSGTPLAPTPAMSDYSKSIATTAFVKGQGYVSTWMLADTLNLNYLPKWNGWIFVNSQIVDNGTNIGIGVPSPTVKLEVAGLIRSTNNGTAYLQWGDDATLNDVNIANTVGIIGIQDSTRGAVQLGSNANSYLAGLWGNIGIGTKDPTTKLDVNGNIKFDSTIYTTGRMHISGGEILYLLNKGGVVIWKEWGGNGNLDVQGGITADNIQASNNVNAKWFVYTSDRRLKDNITPLRDSLEKILSLNGYSYNWKSNGTKDIGVIAQDVETVFPEIVHTDSATGYKSVEYGNLVAPLIEAIKSQQKEIDLLKAEIELLKKTAK